MKTRHRPRLSTEERKVPGWIVNLVAALLSTAVALIGIEVTIRVLERRPRSTWSDRPTLFFMPSSATDMEDAAYTSIKQSDVFRISVLGDSFTFGPRMQLEDTFPKRLERWLNLNQQSPRVEVINRGFSGSSTKDQVNLARTELRGKPDLLILQITLNDAEEHRLSPEEKAARFGASQLQVPLLKNLRFLQFIFNRLNNTASRKEYVRYHASSFEKPETYEPFRKSLQSIAASCKDNGTKIIAVIFPMFDFPFNENYPFQKTHEIIQSTLRSIEVPFLDLLPIYDGIPNEHLLVVPGIDNHPNEIAHRMAAERILLYLRRNHLLPPGSFPVRTYKHRQNLRERRVKPREKKLGKSEESEVVDTEAVDDSQDD